MEQQVEVKSKLGKVKVPAGALHTLIHDGQVELHDAYEAVKNAGIELDHKWFPWLNLVPKDEPKLEEKDITSRYEPEEADAEDNPEGA